VYQSLTMISKQQDTTVIVLQYSPNSTWLVTSRHDTTRHVRRVKPMLFGCVKLVEQHGSTHSTQRARLARHVELDAFDTTGATRHSVCCVICIIPTKVAVYTAVCISILYGCESWTPCRHHIKALESFHISSLQRILGLR